MEDIIFSGTSNRPAKNISEVSIFLDNTDKEGPNHYNDLDEIIVSRRIEREKGSKYFMNGKEIRARDVQTFFADLSTGAHSPSLISQGKIGMLVTSKPSERRSIIEEALLQTMFDLPSMDNVEEVVVNKEVITGASPPLIIFSKNASKETKVAN